VRNEVFIDAIMIVLSRSDHDFLLFSLCFFSFSEQLCCELESVEFDLQNNDDYLPFLTLWEAHEASTFASPSESLHPLGSALSDIPGLTRVAQSLASSQMQSVQRMRQILRMQADALITTLKASAH